jgi:hypothetical protein
MSSGTSARATDPSGRSIPRTQRIRKKRETRSLSSTSFRRASTIPSSRARGAGRGAMGRARISGPALLLGEPDRRTRRNDAPRKHAPSMGRGSPKRLPRAPRLVRKAFRGGESPAPRRPRRREPPERDRRPLDRARRSRPSDPDGDALTYRWFVYPEAGTYRGAVTIEGAESPVARCLAPASAPPKRSTSSSPSRTAAILRSRATPG